MGSSSSSPANNPSAACNRNVESKEVKQLKQELKWLEEMKEDFLNQEIEGVDATIIKDNSIKLQKNFDEYKKNPNMKSYIEALAAHIELTTESSTQTFQNSIKKCGTFKKLMKILEGTDIIKDEKHGKIMKELVQLYYDEWSLLEETSICMKILGNKASKIKMAIYLWRNKLSSGEKPTHDECNVIMKTLSEWFEDDKNTQKLHTKWTNFLKRVSLFKLQFQNVSQSVNEAITKKFKEKCSRLLPKPKTSGWAILGGIIGAGIIKAACVLGAIAVSSVVWTGILVAGAVAAGVGVVAGIGYGAYIGVKHLYGKYKINKEIEHVKDFGDEMIQELDIMIENAKKIKKELHGLTYMVVGQKGDAGKLKFWKDVNFNQDLRKRSIKALDKLYKSLSKFESKCTEIDILAMERLDQFV